MLSRGSGCLEQHFFKGKSARSGRGSKNSYQSFKFRDLKGTCEIKQQDRNRRGNERLSLDD